MATRSRIGIELPNGMIRSVYCHWDGYPEHNGQILLQHYTRRKDVEKLIAGGGMSSLHTRQSHESGSILYENQKVATDELGNVRYVNDREPQPLYYAECGEEIEIHEGTFNQFFSGDLWEDYVYLFTLNDEWKAYSVGWEDTPTTEVKISQEVSKNL